MNYKSSRPGHLLLKESHKKRGSKEPVLKTGMLELACYQGQRKHRLLIVVAWHKGCKHACHSVALGSIFYTPPEILLKLIIFFSRALLIGIKQMLSW